MRSLRHDKSKKRCSETRNDDFKVMHNEYCMNKLVRHEQEEICVWQGVVASPVAGNGRQRDCVGTGPRGSVGVDSQDGKSASRGAADGSVVHAGVEACEIHQ